MVDSGQADLSANFSLNTDKTDLSANVTIRNVKKLTGYKPHGSTDLSANFTIAQNKADLSANFTLNQQIADLSANFTVHNILAYFQHAVESTNGANFLTPQPIENYVIRQANRDKIATIDVKYSNVGDRFSWVTPASILQVFAGTNVNNKTKIFGGHVKEPERVGEEIIFHGQGYGEELLRRKITDAIYDIEATDLIKFHLLDPTTIDTSQCGFVGEETTRSSFHSDSYSDESNIESTSNVSLSAGTWDLDEETDPSGGDWCENNATDWGGDLAESNEGTVKQIGSYSIRLLHVLFFDGFEGDTVGQNPSKWTVYEGGTTNAEVVSSPVAVGSKALFLEDDDVADYVGVQAILGSPTTTTPDIMEWRCRWASGSNDYLVLKVKDSADSTVFQITLEPSISKLRYYDGAFHDIKTGLSADTWYKVKCEYDLDTDTYDIYVDDVKEVTGASFWNTATNLSYMWFYTNSGNNGQEFYIDHVSWGTGGTGNREAYYISTQNLSRNLNNKVQIDVWVRQDRADQDPELRLYYDATNYMKRTIDITAVDEFQRKQYPVGTGASGWTKVGAQSEATIWGDIDWIVFYWSSAQTTVTETYIDGLHFDQYKTSGYIISEDMTTVSEAGTDAQEYFDDAKIDVTKSEPDGSHIITINACNDDGATYESFTDNTWGTFTDHHSSATNHGRIFKVKIEFAGDGTDTPELSAIDIDVKTKKITVYDRVEYDDETLFDAIKDVLYDATLEASTDPDGIYQLDYVRSKTTTDFIPYLRQGYELLKQPVWKKDPRLLINSIKGRGADEGSISKAEEDQWTEKTASLWDETTNITISDETANAYVAEGKYSIKLYRDFSGSTLLSDDFEDADISDWNTVGTAPWTTPPGTDRGEFPPSNYYLRCVPTQAEHYGVRQYLTRGSDAWGDYSFEGLMIVCYGTEGKSGLLIRTDETATNGYYLELDAYNDTMTIYKKTSATLSSLSSESVPLSTRTWYKVKFEGNGTALKGYLNEVEKVSTTDATYSTGRIGFGCLLEYEIGNDLFHYDDVNVQAMPSIPTSKTTTPSFSPLNLNERENIFCKLWANSTSAIEIRLETDVSNYFSWNFDPKPTNEFIDLRLPVGSKSAGWSSTGSPDWRSIIKISFNFSTSNTISTLYLDKLYFTIEPVEATYVDNTSQTTHGVYQGKHYVNKQITSIDELEDRLKTIVALRKNLNEPLDLVVYGRRDIKTGALVKVYYPKSGITDVVFRVDEVNYLLGTMTLTRLFCRDVKTIYSEQRLKELDRETKQIT